MTSDDNIINEKLQYDSNREAFLAKKSALFSGKIVKSEYLTGLPSN